jgi:hypothetical protein
VSILKVIKWRYWLKPLADRDAKANNMLAAFDFDQHQAADDPHKGSKDPAGVGSVLLLAIIVGLAGIAGPGILVWRRARDN